MAWSDEARRAAEEAKRLHAKPKSVGLRATVVHSSEQKAQDLRHAIERHAALLSGGVNPRSHTMARLRKQIKLLSK